MGNHKTCRDHDAPSKDMGSLIHTKDLRQHSWSDFVDQTILDSKDLLIVETGGTTGRPTSVAYTFSGFHANFVAPFLTSILDCEKAFHGPWLYAGPTGPHAIGHGADGCALALTGHSAYRVDLDTRWLHKLEPGIARERYLDHVIGQCADILEVRPVSVLFSTPPLLQRLAKSMSTAQREAITAIHWGGVIATAEDMRAMAVAFPHAVIRAGFGNSLVGLFPQVGQSEGLPVYGYQGGSQSFDVVDDDGHLVSPGDRGHLVFSRDDCCMRFHRLRDRDQAFSVQLADGKLGFRPCQPQAMETVSRVEVIY